VVLPEFSANLVRTSEPMHVYFGEPCYRVLAGKKEFRSMYRMMLMAALVLAALAACGLPSGAQQMGNDAGTAAVELQRTAAALEPTLRAGASSLQQTAAVLAPTLQAQAPGLRQTLEALAPTLQSQAPEVRATLIALATEQPLDGVAVRQTVDALTGGIGSLDDVSLPEQRQMLISTAKKITYTTPQAYGSVIELYQSDMPNRGWQVLPDSAANANASVLRFKKGTRIATVVIAKLAEGTTVDITIDG
jgi:predicted small lipoprotein YifL